MRQRINLTDGRWFDVESTARQFRFVLDDRWSDIYPWETLQSAVQRALTDVDLDTLDQFVDAYLVALLFTGDDDNDPSHPEPLWSVPGGNICDYVTGSDVAELLDADQLFDIVSDCRLFLRHVCGLLTDSDLIESAGHDFHFTRNGHGCGFWDGDWDHGDTLTEIAERFGECELSLFDGAYYLN